VSPFLDRQHGTELCIAEQIERFAVRDLWTVDLYSQKVSQLNPVLEDSAPRRPETPGAIIWHKVSDIPGPHLVKYLWWFSANQRQRRRDLRIGKIVPDLVYSPGINCVDADVIVVHIVFHAFYASVQSELALSRASLSNWPLLLHRKLYYKLIMSLERKIYTNSSVKLIAVSGLVAEQLKRYFQRTDVVVIPDAVDTARFNPKTRIVKRNNARELRGYSDRDFVVLLIGNDWKKKGLDVLLKAVACIEAPNLHVLVVGRDDDSRYQPVIKQLGLDARVRFEKPMQDVLSFYAAADLYAGPSLEDAFNLPILETMACGLPVIASSQTGASEMMCDKETGFILRDPHDHIQLADLIRQFYSSESLCKTMGEAAARQVAANCSWEQNAASTREFLMKTLQERT
jgi:glycosyltransferase involved in cell wall biosynthesis